MELETRSVQRVTTLLRRQQHEVSTFTIADAGRYVGGAVGVCDGRWRIRPFWDGPNPAVCWSDDPNNVCWTGGIRDIGACGGRGGCPLDTGQAGDCYRDRRGGYDIGNYSSPTSLEAYRVDNYPDPCDPCYSGRVDVVEEEEGSEFVAKMTWIGIFGAAFALTWLGLDRLKKWWRNR